MLMMLCASGSSARDDYDIIVVIYYDIAEDAIMRAKSLLRYYDARYTLCHYALRHYLWR